MTDAVAAPIARITFRALALDDLPMLQAWVRRPHVAEWWDDDTSLEALREYYGPSIAGEEPGRQFIAMLDGEPIGFIQHYRAVDCHADGWWLAENDPGVFGIDQFLAESGRLGQGLGTAMISAFVRTILCGPGVTRIQVDPDPRNARAIRCYAKVGFREQAVVRTPDGDAQMMYLDPQRAQPST
ncbi:MAG: GNAT family N-acetyltransferase [Gemmatimonadaceae bacterium]|nr:GNAT family N-acetyltransferase [Gemmatimonadaceae bacterium]